MVAAESLALTASITFCASSPVTGVWVWPPRIPTSAPFEAAAVGVADGVSARAEVLAETTPNPATAAAARDAAATPIFFVRVMVFSVRCRHSAGPDD